MKRILVGVIFLWGMTMGLADKNVTAGPLPQGNFQKATFAGGCFWCMEAPFEKLPGVKGVTSGYTGGQTENPSYEEVSSGESGHAEAVEVLFDPSEISYAELLDVFWRNIDPTALNKQFVDTGVQYRTAIFYHNEEQRRLAEESRDRLAASGRFDKPIVTDIAPATAFYKAEDYHQDYYKKNPVRYNLYRFGSGRDQYLKKIWGKEKEGGGRTCPLPGKDSRRE